VLERGLDRRGERLSGYRGQGTGSAFDEEGRDDSFNRRPFAVIPTLFAVIPTPFAVIPTLFAVIPTEAEESERVLVDPCHFRRRLGSLRCARREVSDMDALASESPGSLSASLRSR
jgi:hypothetical protein